MHIHIITCVWQRPQIAQLFFDHYTQLLEQMPPSNTLSMCVCGSPNDNVLPLMPKWAHYTSHSNQPLGNKWNKALEASKCIEFDYVLVMGSDDFINLEGLNWLFDQARKGFDFVGFKDMYMVDSATKRVAYWRGYEKRPNTTIGAGRLIKREVIEALNWKLWSPTKRKGLDGSMGRIMKKELEARGLNIKRARMIDENVRLFDLKSGQNMNSFNDMGSVVNVRNANFFSKHYSNELKKKIDAL